MNFIINHHENHHSSSLITMKITTINHQRIEQFIISHRGTSIKLSSAAIFTKISTALRCFPAVRYLEPSRHGKQPRKNMAGWWYTDPSEKYQSVGVMKFPIYGKLIQMFQTTNQMGIFAGLKWGQLQIIQKHGACQYETRQVTTGDPHLKKPPLNHIKFNQTMNKHRICFSFNH